jgi:uncharacterized protein (DUF1330 family)
VAEIAVRDKDGYEENYLKATQKDVSNHGGKYLAGGYDKTVSLSGAEPPNRVVIVQFAGPLPGFGRATRLGRTPVIGL